MATIRRMAQLTLEGGRRTREPGVIGAELAPLSIRLDRWPVGEDRAVLDLLSRPSLADAEKVQVLAGLDRYFHLLRDTAGYQTRDLIVLHPEVPGLDEMLANVERATTRESLRLGNRVANLARLGGVVLLVDLFGTTAGLMSTLQVIEILKEPTVSDFVRGILEALVCAALGLVVALFCFVAFFWLDARLTQRCLEVRDIAEELVR